MTHDPFSPVCKCQDKAYACWRLNQELPPRPYLNKEHPRWWFVEGVDGLKDKQMRRFFDDSRPMKPVRMPKGNLVDWRIEG